MAEVSKTQEEAGTRGRQSLLESMAGGQGPLLGESRKEAETGEEGLEATESTAQWEPD